MNTSSPITGPEADLRQEMLEEALDVIRQLWRGKQVSHYGVHYIVENTRIYTLPESLPPIFLAASGPKSAKLAGQTGDGLIATSPKAELLKQFRNAGGDGKPCYAEMAVCWDEDEKRALHTAYEYWPNLAMTGELSQQLPVPAHFEQAAQMIRVEDLAEGLVRGNDSKTLSRSAA